MKLLPVLLFLALPAVAQTQFTFTTNADNTLTITGYSGSNGVVTIPSTIEGMSVASIGYDAFDSATSLTNVTIVKKTLRRHPPCSSLLNRAQIARHWLGDISAAVRQ